MAKYIILALLFLFYSCTNIETGIEIQNNNTKDIKINQVSKDGIHIFYESEKNGSIKINNEEFNVIVGENNFYLTTDKSYIHIDNGQEAWEYPISRNNNEKVYRVSHKEYLLLSLFSYAPFEERHINLNLYEVLLKEHDLLTNGFNIFTYMKLDEAIEPFLEFYKEILERWYILKIWDNSNSDREGVWDDGFYSIAFYKNNIYGEMENIVAAYRGSEFFPFTEAYKDFVRTNLFIGLRSKPSQFEEGARFYRELIREYDYEKVSLTGHSLGGGIAQYVAATSQRIDYLDYIPRTVTFNSIGILVEGMIDLIDYIDFKNYIEEDPNIPEYIKEQVNFIVNIFRTELPKDINIPRFKRTGQLDFRFHSIKARSMENKLSIGIRTAAKREDLRYIVENYYSEEFLKRKLLEAKFHLNNFEENISFKSSVVNFIHSDDFTANFFPQLGSSYIVNQGYKATNLSILNSFFREEVNLSRSTRLIRFHQPNVFIPYFTNKEGMKNIGSTINKEYIFYKVKTILNGIDEGHELYYIDTGEEFKVEVLNLIREENGVYIEEIIRCIERLNQDEFEEFIKLIDEKDNFLEYNIWNI